MQKLSLLRQVTKIGILTFGLCMSSLLMADDCFELYNYYGSRPTNYATRGGDGWMATSAAVEPTSSMYFYSQYEYVMLTGGNKNTSPGQLEVNITPAKGVDVLTFEVAKPCISDRYCGAGVYVYADGVLVYQELVTASSLSYRTVTVPVDKDCKQLRIFVTNYYTNTTKDHNNRIAFAHFCWKDYKGTTPPTPPVDPEHPDDPPTPPQPPVHVADTAIYAGYVCYDALPFLWNGLELTRQGDYSYTTKGSSGRDSTTILRLTVSPQPTTQTEHREMTVGEKMVWNGRTFIPTIEGDTLLMDSIYDSQGCKRTIYKLYIHVNPRVEPPAPHIGVVNHYLCPGESIKIDGAWYVASTQSKDGGHEFIQKVYPGGSHDGADSISQIHIWISPAVQVFRRDTSICKGSSFVWYGQTLSEAKSYTHTISSVNNTNCDSIRYVLRVGYLPSPELVETYMLCPSQLPFRWRGKDYNATGTYTETVSAPSGCDSTYVLRLTVLSTLTGDTTAWCCLGDLPYQWYGQTLNEAGDYTHNTVSVAGCDSVVTLHLHVRPAPRVEHVDLTSCNGEDVPWRDRLYRLPGTYYDTVWSMLPPYCDSAYYSMTLTTYEPSYSFITLTVCHEELPYEWNGLQLQLNGEYTARLKNVVGCDSIVTASFRVAETDNVVVQKTLCTAQMPYVWNGQTCTAAGSYTHKAKNMNGCDSTTTLQLTVNSYSQADTSAWVCVNDLPYTWHGKTLTSSGTAQWKTTNDKGCDSIVTLHLYASGTPKSYKTDTSVCEGTAVRWRGRVLRDEGTYRDTVYTRTPSHCDSIYYELTLHHLLRTDSLTVATICQGESYTWHGRTYTRTAQDQEVLTNVAGCDSVCTLRLTVRPQTYSITEYHLCVGDSVKVRERWLKHAGIYSDTLPGANVWGCDSVCHAKVLFHPAPKENKIGVRLYPEELPYEWRGKNYTTDGLYSDTIKSTITGCDSVYYRLDFHVLDECETKPTVKNY